MFFFLFLYFIWYNLEEGKSDEMKGEGGCKGKKKKCGKVLCNC